MDGFIQKVLSFFIKPAPAAPAAPAQPSIPLPEEIRAYEATQTSRLRNPLKTQSIGSPDWSIQQAGTSLTKQARWMDENHDIAVGILDKLVDRIIGQGLSIEPMVMNIDGSKAADYNKTIRQIYQDWSESPEVTGELSEGMLDAMACRAWLRDGECFLRLLSGNFPILRGKNVPFALQFLESDFCPLEYTDTSNRIIQGIEKDGWQRPIAYYFYRENPYGMSIDGTLRVPSLFVLHPKFTRRCPQTRGVSIFHSVINRLLEIKSYDDSERLAARVAAAMVFQVRRGPNSTSKTRVSNADRSLDVSPGMVWDNFGMDEWAEIITSDRPNVNLEKYRNGQLRAAGSGVRLPFSDISNQYDGTYSAQRQELVTGWQSILTLRAAYIRMAVLKRWWWFIDMALLAGVLPPPPREVDQNTLYKFDARGPSMPWIDPVKEAQAAILQIDNYLSNRAAFIRDRGGQPDDIFSTLIAEKELLEKVGFKQPPKNKQETEEEENAE